jgi:hypothetical protein
MIAIERQRICEMNEQNLGGKIAKPSTKKEINGDFLPDLKELTPLICAYDS